MSIADLRPALRAFLLGDSAVNAAVGGKRIYPLKLPQGELLPSLVLVLVSGAGDHTMQGASGLARPRYQVDAWAQTLDLASALKILTKGRLDGYAGPMAWTADAITTTVNVQGCFFESEREDYDAVAKLYRSSADYLIWFEER